MSLAPLCLSVETEAFQTIKNGIYSVNRALSGDIGMMTGGTLWFLSSGNSSFDALAW